MKLTFVSIVAVAIVLAVFLLSCAVFAVILLLAWNLVVPGLFGAPSLTFETSFALVILTNLIRLMLFSGRSK